MGGSPIGETLADENWRSANGHLANRIDHNLRLIQLNPVPAAFRQNVPSSAAALRDGFVLGAFLRCQVPARYDRNRDRRIWLRFKNSGRDRGKDLKVSRHALKRLRPAPVRLNRRP